MQNDGRLAKLEALLSQHRGIDSVRLNALVFIAQVLGEDYNYTFNVHHFRVFSPVLESDLEYLSVQGLSEKSQLSGTSKHILDVTQSATLEEVEAAAAFLYFEQKGYSVGDIEQSFNADAGIVNGAKALIAEFRKTPSKQLAASGVG